MEILKKTHKNSKIIRFNGNSPRAAQIFDVNQPYIEYDTYHEHIRKNIVVLQVMPIQIDMHTQEYVVEYVDTEHYFLKSETTE